MGSNEAVSDEALHPGIFQRSVGCGLNRVPGHGHFGRDLRFHRIGQAVDDDGSNVFIVEQGVGQALGPARIEHRARHDESGPASGRQQ